MSVKPHGTKHLGAGSFVLDLSGMADHFPQAFCYRLDTGGARGQTPRARPCFRASRGKLPGSFPFHGVTHFTKVNGSEAWMDPF